MRYYLIQVSPGRTAGSGLKHDFRDRFSSVSHCIIRDLPDFEDIVKALMDGVGHGFSALEIVWRKDGNEWLPRFEQRPQEWFQTTVDRTRLTLRDGSADGAELQPFGWMLHQHGIAKTGYLGKFPLYRVLAWPFLYKLYGISDFAELLEIYGLPIIMGKYPSGASDEQKKSLQRAVMQLAHDARAVMPADMAIEIAKITTGGGSSGHLDIVSWGDKSQSKAILGGTLTSQADGKTSTNALGNVHQDVRRDIRNSDCRQIVGTLTRDLIYPILALNKGGIDNLRRCPRFMFDTGEAEDLSLYAESLPKLVGIGMKIPSRYAHDKLKIPEPEGDEDILSAAMSTATPQPVAAATIGTRMNAPVFTPKQQAVEDLGDQLLQQLGSPINPEAIHAAIKAAKDPEDLEQRLAALMADTDTTQFQRTLERALFAADVLGYVHAE